MSHLSWAHALILTAALAAAVIFAAVIIGERHGSFPRRRNRFRRGVLPTPRRERQLRVSDRPAKDERRWSDQFMVDLKRARRS